MGRWSLVGCRGVVWHVWLQCRLREEGVESCREVPQPAEKCTCGPLPACGGVRIRIKGERCEAEGREYGAFVVNKTLLQFSDWRVVSSPRNFSRAN